MHYNGALPWIQEQIDNPEYIMIQPDQYVEPVLEPDDEDYDEIPF